MTEIIQKATEIFEISARVTPPFLEGHLLKTHAICGAIEKDAGFLQKRVPAAAIALLSKIVLKKYWALPLLFNNATAPKKRDGHIVANPAIKNHIDSLRITKPATISCVCDCSLYHAGVALLDNEPACDRR